MAALVTDTASFSPMGPTSPLLTPAATPANFPGLPRDDTHMNVHTVVIVVIFCVVCFLLLAAVFYAVCFRCSIGPLPKDRGPTPSADHEDATFRRSSSCPSVGNSI